MDDLIRDEAALDVLTGGDSPLSTAIEYARLVASLRAAIRERERFRLETLRLYPLQREWWAERDRLRAELDHVDNALARRPALDDLNTRAEKIERAINVAKRSDRLRALLGEMRPELQRAYQFVERDQGPGNIMAEGWLALLARVDAELSKEGM